MATTHKPTNLDGLRNGPRISIVRDFDNDADHVELTAGISAGEPQFAVCAEFYHGRADLHAFLGSCIEYQMTVLGLSLVQAAHLAQEDPAGFLPFTYGSPDVSTDRLIKVAIALGVRIEVGPLGDPYDVFDMRNREACHE